MLSDTEQSSKQLLFIINVEYYYCTSISNRYELRSNLANLRRQQKQSASPWGREISQNFLSIWSYSDVFFLFQSETGRIKKPLPTPWNKSLAFRCNIRSDGLIYIEGEFRLIPDPRRCQI